MQGSKESILHGSKSDSPFVFDNIISLPLSHRIAWQRPLPSELILYAFWALYLQLNADRMDITMAQHCDAAHAKSGPPETCQVITELEMTKSC